MWQRTHLQGQNCNMESNCYVLWSTRRWMGHSRNVLVKPSKSSNSVPGLFKISRMWDNLNMRKLWGAYAKLVWHNIFVRGWALETISFFFFQVISHLMREYSLTLSHLVEGMTQMHIFDWSDDMSLEYHYDKVNVKSVSNLEWCVVYCIGHRHTKYPCCFSLFNITTFG